MDVYAQRLQHPLLFENRVAARLGGDDPAQDRAKRRRPKNPNPRNKPASPAGRTTMPPTHASDRPPARSQRNEERARARGRKGPSPAGCGTCWRRWHRCGRSSGSRCSPRPSPRDTETHQTEARRAAWGKRRVCARDAGAVPRFSAKGQRGGPPVGWQQASGRAGGRAVWLKTTGRSGGRWRKSHEQPSFKTKRRLEVRRSTEQKVPPSCGASKRPEMLR